jgi:hypothetical protein
VVNEPPEDWEDDPGVLFAYGEARAARACIATLRRSEGGYRWRYLTIKQIRLRWE